MSVTREILFKSVTRYQLRLSLALNGGEKPSSQTLDRPSKMAVPIQ